jgi:hypothetical protein
VAVGDAVDVLEVNAASMFRMEVDHEVGGSIYVRNTGNIAHSHTVKQPKKKVNITAEVQKSSTLGPLQNPNFI